jgi:hypothetical protein
MTIFLLLSNLVVAALIACVVRVVAIADAAPARNVRLAAICRLTWHRTAAFSRIGQIRALVTAARPAIVAIGSFRLARGRHGSPVLLIPLVCGVLLDVTLATLQGQIAVNAALVAVATSVRVQMLLIARAFWAAVLGWNGR